MGIMAISTAIKYLYPYRYQYRCNNMLIRMATHSRCIPTDSSQAIIRRNPATLDTRANPALLVYPVLPAGLALRAYLVLPDYPDLLVYLDPPVYLVLPAGPVLRERRCLVRNTRRLPWRCLLNRASNCNVAWVPHGPVTVTQSP